MNLVFEDFLGLRIETEFFIGKDIVLDKEMIGFDNADKALIVVDNSVHDQEHVRRFIDKVRETYKELFIIENNEIEPKTTTVNSMVRDFRGSGVNIVFGVGGGSTMDIAKAVAVLLTNTGLAEDYQGLDKLQKPGALCVTVPTVAGSGAEITPSAVLIDPVRGIKGGINGRFVAPTRALLDPLITLKAPMHVTMYAAFDAFVHAIESYTCKLASPIVKMFAKEALMILLRAIPGVIDNPEDVDIRQSLLLATELAAISLMHSQPGPMSAFSYQLAIRHGVPHGLGNAIMITKTMDIQMKKGADYSFLYDLIEKMPSVNDKRGKSLVALAYITAIIEKADIPKNLEFYGFTPDYYDELARFVDTIKKGFPTAITAFNKQDLLKVLTNMA